MKFTVLCSGSKGNSTLVETEQIKILLDCGHSKRYLTQSLHNCGVHYDQIDAVIITHNHIDHVSQLKLFKNQPVYAPCLLRDRDDTIILGAYKWFKLGDLSILSVPLSHDADETFGYVIQHDDESLVYITDTGYLKETDFYIFESNHDVELLMQTQRPYPVKSRILSDSGHLSNEDSASYLARLVGLNTKTIFLAHLSSEANTERHALQALVETFENQKVIINPDLILDCAKQNEPVTGGTI
ncbi:MAG: metallo-beta-lactamase family protein [Erysipelotrichaceae bacterium]|nr:MAG: metallo-beta-lactamase family protein [Erysipelotrichaceae bacterium]